MNKSMLLITSSWGSKKTFKMIPATPDAPYNEAIFDLESKVLAVIGKEKKDSMHMVAKLNEWGDPVSMKIGKRSNGKDYAEERKTLEAFYEYYIEDMKEIEDFIKSVAVNAETFNVSQYLNVVEEAPKTGNLITSI
jgi:hypothetical protein